MPGIKPGMTAERSEKSGQLPGLGAFVLGVGAGFVDVRERLCDLKVGR